MTIIIGKSKNEQRAFHWRDIQTRVRTHEGEMLSGEKGKKYQEKYSKKYLGRDLGNVKPITVSDVERYQWEKEHRR